MFVCEFVHAFMCGGSAPGDDRKLVVHMLHIIFVQLFILSVLHYLPIACTDLIVNGR